MKRRRPEPDTRPDWRDPDMLVRRNYKFHGRVVKFVPPEYEQGYRAHLMDTVPVPHWSEDPTYNLGRKK